MKKFITIVLMMCISNVANAVCTVANLKGTYGLIYSYEDPYYGHCSSIGSATVDKFGNLLTSGELSCGGNLFADMIAGTMILYSKDCTGYLLTQDGYDIEFIMVNAKKDIHLSFSLPGITGQGFMTRQ
jgi:hypothetical protein